MIVAGNLTALLIHVTLCVETIREEKPAAWLDELKAALLAAQSQLSGMSKEHLLELLQEDAELD
jgi:hypothetical protein